MNRILAGSGLVRLHLLVAIRSREGKYFRHAGSAVAESRPIFTAAVVLLGSSITRTRRQATRHYLLFRWSIARSQVTRHCVLRALIEPVVFQVSRAVEKSPITLRVWSLMTVDSSDCAKPEEPVWFCLKVQSKREHLVASGLRKQFGIVCFVPRLLCES